MNITLLEDNTVSAKYKDGSSEVINSTHSHKAKSKLTKLIADAFPYKGARVTKESIAEGIAEGNADKYNYELVNGEISAKDDGLFFEPDADHHNMVFDTAAATIQYGDQIITPETMSLTGDLSTFCNIIWDNGGRAVWETKQAQIALQTQDSNDG